MDIDRDRNPDERSHIQLVLLSDDKRYRIQMTELEIPSSYLENPASHIVARKTF
jgi:hypothetical protein